MSESRRVRIERLATGVPGLDAIIGGGLPQFSCNLIAGAPGTGKTTLVQQIAFANASDESPVLYFTVLGEPTIKMLRYQQQMTFFDPDKVDRVIRFVNLSDEVLQGDLSKVLSRIMREVEEMDPGIVIVDSFRTVVRSGGTSGLDLQTFLQHLSLYLTSWQATTFMVGEYLETELRDNPVFTVADGILWLFQSIERNSIVRKLQVMKMRGQEPLPGLHTFRITHNGIQVFPRTSTRVAGAARARPRPRTSMGVVGLDEMLGGGVPAGDSVLVAGPSGSGKTMLGIQFIAEGIRQGEPGVIAVFEEYPQEYIDRVRLFGFDPDEMIDQGKLKVMYLRPLDLSVDEILQELRDSVEKMGAKRVVIDSLSSFELALAPTFREDFRESLYRMVGSLTGMNVTVLMTVEVTEAYDELRFSPHTVSFLTDDIILQRYVEIEGQLKKVMTVVKMRSSEHSGDLRGYEVTSRGVVVGEALREYQGIITGVPRLREPTARSAYPGLTGQEVLVLQSLIELREGTAEAVSRHAGLSRSVSTDALNRLVALNYAIKVAEGGRTSYRPVARALGQ